MDGQRFDEVVRLIGAGLTRRRVLRALLGGTAAVAAGAALAPRAGAQEGLCAEFGSVCSEEFPCCSPNNCEYGGCFGASCEGVSEEGGSCTDSEECCGFLSCVEDTCTQTCSFLGQECGSDEDCCSSPVCVEGVCALSESTCAALRESCESDGDCCGEPAGMFCAPTTNQCVQCDDGGDVYPGDCGVGALCQEGECLTCSLPGKICSIPQGGSPNFCCPGFTCVDDACVPVVPAAECEVDEDCVLQAAGDVDAVICCGGFCITDIECCIDDEDPNARCAEGSSCFEGICVFACKGDSDCATDTCCCSDGTCYAECCDDSSDTPPTNTGGVTTLPNTGIGDGDGNLNGLLGAGIAAAGAAYLAGKKLRAGEDEA